MWTALFSCLVLAASVATAEGVGPLKIGLTLDAVRSLAQEPIPEIRPQPSVGCDYLALQRMPSLRLMFVDRILVRIDIIGSGVSVPEGVQVGDPIGKLGGSTGFIREPHAYDSRGMYLTRIEPAKRSGVRIEVREGVVHKISIGRSEQIQWEEQCN